MTEKEIQDIVKATIDNLNDSRVLNQKELSIIEDNISYIMAGLIGLKFGLQHNPNMVNLLETFDTKCLEVLKVLDKKV